MEGVAGVEFRREILDPEYLAETMVKPEACGNSASFGGEEWVLRGRVMRSSLV